MNKLRKITKYLPFIFLRAKYRLLGNFLSNKYIRLYNFKILIQDITSFYYEVIYIFKDEIYKFTSQKDTPLIIDGGVCIGTSLLYFKKIYPTSKIIGFEPDGLAFKIANENISQNKLSDIKLHNVALYNSNTEISFETKSIDSNKISSSGTVKVSAHKLSSYITEQVDFLKLNIEGAEYYVLQDLHESGKIKMINEMCLEWHSFANQEQNLSQVLDILQRNNFKYYISSLSTAPHGAFSAEKETEYFLMVYAKQIK